jgi:hypothetical protein
MEKKNENKATDASAIPESDQESEYATIMAQKRSIQDRILATTNSNDQEGVYSQIQNQGFQQQQLYSQNQVTAAIDPRDLEVTQAIDPQYALDAVRQHESQYSNYQPFQNQGNDQTALYAQIQNQGFQQQQALSTQNTDDTQQFLNAQQNYLLNKPQDEQVGVYSAIDPRSQDTGVTQAIVPNAGQRYDQAANTENVFNQQQGSNDQTSQFTEIMSNYLRNKPADESVGVTQAIVPNAGQQYGQVTGTNEAFGQQANVDQNNDNTAEYLYAIQTGMRNKPQDEPVDNEGVSQAILPNAQQEYGQSTQSNPTQVDRDTDETSQYAEIERAKSEKRSRLEQQVEQVVIEAPGLSPAIDPTAQQAQSVSQNARSWEVLNSKPFYIPQQQQLGATWQDYDTRNFNSLNSQDQTSEYLNIMAQQRAIQNSQQQYY